MELHLYSHGGDVLGVAATFGIDPKRLLDFSANINPFGPSQSVLDAVREAAADVSALTQYPQPRAPHLTQKIAARFGIDPATIVIGHGSAGLLDAIVHALRPRTALMPVPAFSEYHRVCAATNCTIVPFVLESRNDFRLDINAFLTALATIRPDIVLLNNPHNPSGSLLSRADILTIVNAAASHGVLTIVDEAFIDYVPEDSTLDVAAQSNTLIVLRSFTKFYAFPGLRVGYAVSVPENIRRIEHTLPSWPVSSVALSAAEATLDDDVFERHTLKQNAIERTRMIEALSALGLRVTPSSANYLFVDCGALAKTARKLREKLIIRSSIIVRACDDYASLENTAYIRIAVRGSEDNDRLLAALASFVPLVKNDV